MTTLCKHGRAPWEWCTPCDGAVFVQDEWADRPQPLTRRQSGRIATACILAAFALALVAYFVADAVSRG